MNRLDTPLFTREIFPASEYRPDTGTLIICGPQFEDRHGWIQAFQSGSVFTLDDTDSTGCIVKVTHSEGNLEVPLRGSGGLDRLWCLLQSLGDRVVIDLTSLSHHQWAPLLRFGLRESIPITAAYAEPLDYRATPIPATEGEIFDLSERINGIKPIPGFSCLSGEDEPEFVLITLLGFEGHRFAHLVESVQPLRGQLIPIIGAPGFLPEFLFYAYLGNKQTLLDTQSWKEVRYVPANCPYSLAVTLNEIAQSRPSSFLKIAPIGTKPHALGAFLFSHKYRRQVEFIYDHPVRKGGRTSGLFRLFLYDVRPFLS